MTTTRSLPLQRLARRSAAVIGGVALFVGAFAPASLAAADPAIVPLGVGFRPEGVESGPGDTYYVGSLADGRIRTGDLSRGTGRTLLAGVTGRALRGLYHDARTGLVWAAGNDGTTGIVLAVDARTGAVVSRTVVPGALFLNDLVVSRGSVWVTDSRVDRLTRLPLGSDGRVPGAPVFVPLGGAWPVSTDSPRANGIRALDDGTLLLDNSSSGGIWAVDPATGVATSVPVSGGPGITAGDGLELVGATLYVVRGSGDYVVSVVSLRRTPAGWAATWNGRLTSPGLDVPSTATFAAGRLWAVNARFTIADPTTATFAIVPLPRYPGSAG